GSAEPETLLATVDRITDVFREVDLLSAPVGFEVKGNRRVSYEEAGARLELNLYLYPYYRKSDGTITSSSIEYTGHIMVYGNDPSPPMLFAGGVRGAGDERWFLEPRRVARRGGYPEYETAEDARTKYRGPHRFVLITAPDTPDLWLPVSNEELITHNIEQHKRLLAQQRERAAELPSGAEIRNAQIEGMQAAMEQIDEQIRMFPEMREQLLEQKEQLQEVLRGLEEEEGGSYGEYDRMRKAAPQMHDEVEEELRELERLLHEMPEAEKRQQARASLNFRQAETADSSYLVPAGTAGGSRVHGVTRINPALFEDPRRAGSGRQFLIVSLYGGTPEMRRRLDSVAEQLDWEALADILN
ncbi:MAG: hypothetical protein ACLFUX_09420, partial [Spirochaetaceae bacterium]